MRWYNTKMKQISRSIEDTKALAKKFVSVLEPWDHAVVVALVGDLGSSKTTFSQLVGEALGVRDSIQSPTFIIEKIYELFDRPWKHLVHIDAYRLDSSEELLSLGWQDIIARKENLILIEWADKVEDILPPDTIFLHFTFIDEHTREIEITSKPLTNEEY
jgi:tRNA threonylcarbamoyladenosine biosynthesis protein TsaE